MTKSRAVFLLACAFATVAMAHAAHPGQRRRSSTSLSFSCSTFPPGATEADLVASFGRSNVTTAMVAAGYGSSSRLYERATNRLGMTPGQYRSGGLQNGEPVTIPPYGLNILLAGSSGGGKSTLATGLLERLAEKRYQFCIIDPEGDYQAFRPAVALGDTRHTPTVDEVLQLLKNPTTNAIVNLVGQPLKDRPAFFAALLPRLQELRVHPDVPR